jgi:hypothetical protein
VKPVANNVVSATILRPILLPLKRDCSREFYGSCFFLNGKKSLEAGISCKQKQGEKPRSYVS